MAFANIITHGHPSIIPGILARRIAYDKKLNTSQRRLIRLTLTVRIPINPGTDELA